MDIMITGSEGFIGQHLLWELLDANHNCFQVDKKLDLHHDLRTTGAAVKLIEQFKPEVVVHLAAKVGRQFGEKDPMETTMDNAGMTALVAQACGDAGARLVYASTSEIYGDHGEGPWCDEETGPFTLPHNLYGLSKRWGEEVCSLYAPEGLTILRLSMPYGPGLMWGKGRAAIINMLHQALHRELIPVHRRSERSWCWIGDTVRAIRMIIEKTDSGVFNVGRDDDVRSMYDIARRACTLTDAPLGLIHEVDPPPMQTVIKRLATSRIRRLGWEPTVDIMQGMETTLEWIKECEDALQEREAAPVHARPASRDREEMG